MIITKYDNKVTDVGPLHQDSVKKRTDVTMGSGDKPWFSYQKSIQGFLKNWSDESRKYKAILFSPFEERTAAGESTRKKSPYFLINVATREELHLSHTKLLDSKYFDNFSEEELKKLKVKKDKK